MSFGGVLSCRVAFPNLEVTHTRNVLRRLAYPPYTRVCHHDRQQLCVATPGCYILLHRTRPYVSIKITLPDEVLTAVHAILANIHSSAGMCLLAALFDRNLLVDDLATVRAVANRWNCTLMIGIKAATLMRYHILLPSARPTRNSLQQLGNTVTHGRIVKAVFPRHRIPEGRISHTLARCVDQLIDSSWGVRRRKILAATDHQPG